MKLSEPVLLDVTPRAWVYRLWNKALTAYLTAQVHGARGRDRMKQHLDEQVYDPRAPAATTDGQQPGVPPVPYTVAAEFNSPGTASTDPAEMTEVAYLRALQEEQAVKIAGLFIAVQRVAQELHDIRCQGLVRR